MYFIFLYIGFIVYLYVYCLLYKEEDDIWGFFFLFGFVLILGEKFVIDGINFVNDIVKIIVIILIGIFGLISILLLLIFFN